DRTALLCSSTRSVAAALLSRLAATSCNSPALATARGFSQHPFPGSESTIQNPQRGGARAPYAGWIGAGRLHHLAVPQRLFSQPSLVRRRPLNKTPQEAREGARGIPHSVPIATWFQDEPPEIDAAKRPPISTSAQLSNGVFRPAILPVG